MKKIIRILCVTLALATLCGCGAPAATEPVATEPAAPLLTEVNTQSDLMAALETSPRTVLTGDIQLTQMIGVKNRILDGGGHTIIGMPYVEGDAATENAVMVTSGTVENLTIRGAYRCLGDCEEYPLIGDVRIKNVTADGTLLAMAFGRGGKNGSVYVQDSTLRGWVLINGIQDARFENCTFGYNSEGKNGYLRVYRDVTLVNCNFENLVDANGKVTRYNINFHKDTKGKAVILENCYVGDTLITEDNVETLLKVALYNNRLEIRNVVE